MKKVLELPAFRRLLVAAVVNELAFSVATVALALLVYRRTGSAIGAMAFFLCSQFGPGVISPLVVARFDRESPRHVLARLFALEAAVFLVLAWLVGRFSVVAVLALALADGVLSVTARVFARAAWTSITSPAGLLREANALINTSLATAFMVGPALAGLVVALGGTADALLLNAGLFLLVALTTVTARSIPTAIPDPSPAAGRLRESLAYARTVPLIRRLLTLQAVAWVFFTISVPVEVVLARHTLNAGPGGYGLLLSAFGAGGVLGSMLYTRWRRLPHRGLMTLGTCLFGGGFLVMAISPVIAVAIIGSGVAGLGNGLQVVSFRTVLQEAIPERWMARILSLNEVIFQVLPGAGILLGGSISALAGPRVALAIAAAGSVGLAVAMWTKLALSQAATARIHSSASGASEEALTATGPQG